MHRPLFLLAGLALALGAGCGSDDDDLVDSDTDGDTGDTRTAPELGPIDVNGDGDVRVLVIASSLSIDRTVGFSADGVASELQAILEGDADIEGEVEVVARDIYRTANIDTGYGQRGDTYTWPYSAHSLAQFLYWPEGREARWADLGGQGTAWDHVVLAGDPQIVSQTPGYFAMGVHRVASRVSAGGAQPILLTAWPAGADAQAIEGLSASVRRVADLAAVDVRVAPAAPAWGGLDASLQDTGTLHPSPNGAYLSAAAIYGQMAGRSASESAYDYDAQLADAAWGAVEQEWSRDLLTGSREAADPFAACGLSDRVLNYNHTGTSSENGILRGLRWTLDKARVELVKNGDAPIDFNYGRANTEFEANKRYEIDASKFEFSLGFPMQDHSNNGDTSMLYGLDQRRFPGENGTDLGVARYMITAGELPQGRAVPIRALYAQMQEAMPDQSAYSDGWHMNGDLDRATGAFMYTLLTGHCALDEEPADTSSGAWRSWMAHKTGYETAWAMTQLAGEAPCFRVLPESKESTWVSGEQTAALDVSFAMAPSADVTVSLSLSDGGAASLSATELVFTPSDHAVAQTITLSGTAGEGTTVELIATTRSEDPAFDGLVDRWTYEVRP